MMQSPPAHHDHELEEHDRGLVYDLGTLDRRRVLKLLGFGGLSAGLFTLVGCGPDGATGSASARTASLIWRTCSGVVPQHPPTMLIPNSSTYRITPLV